MGRYVYDASLVSQAIDELNRAINSLSDVNTEIQAGINTINSATGANWIDVDYSKLLQLQTTAEDVIEEDIRVIQEKVTVIEDYENAPWLKKMFASAGMALTKFGEGIASTVEDLGDGVASIIGFVGGIFSSDFQESCAEYVKKDHVGDWFNKQYESGALSSIQKYSWYSKDSLGANIFKGIGCAAPYVALSMTGVGLVTETLAAGVGGIGSGTEAGLQQGKSFNKAFASGLWQGTKNAALVYGMGKLAKGIQTNAAGKTGQLVKGSADDFAKLTTGTADEVAATAKNVIGCTDDLTAIPLDDGFRLVKSGSELGDDVGRVIFNGDNVIINSFDDMAGAAKNFNGATRVIANSGDELVFNTMKNADDLVGSSFNQLTKANVAGTADKVFTKAGEFKDTRVGRALNASDDALTSFGTKIAKSKPGQVVSGIGSRIVGSKPVQAVVNSGIVNKVATAVTNTVTKHPVASFATAAAVFTADQIDEQVTGTQYRLAQEELDAATIKTQPVIEPTPTITAMTPPGPDGGDTNNNIPPDNNGGDSGLPDNNGGGTGGWNNNSNNTIGGGLPDNNGGTNLNNDTTNNRVVDVTTPTVTPPTVSSSEVTKPTTPTVTAPTTSKPVDTTPNTSTPETSTPSITNKPVVNTPSSNTGRPSSSSGAGYSGTGYTGESSTGTASEIEIPGEETMAGSFSELIDGGNDYTKIPTSSAPITTTTTGQKKSIIPVIAGLSAAAVAGIGTKAYLDKKENNENEDNGFAAEEWTEDSLDVDYSEAMEDDRDYLDPSDEYAYQDNEEDTAGSYEAVNSSELASMQ